MADTVHLDRRDQVFTLTIGHGKLNALGPRVVRNLHDTLDELDARDDVRALIVTGGPGRFFSFGLDVEALLPLDRPAMGEFLSELNRMLQRFYEFPAPVVAAINGHAAAGGLLLALTADLRVATAGEFKLGLTEIQLGLTAPGSSVRMLEQRVGHATARAVCFSGELYEPHRAKELGLVDEVVAAEALSERAHEHAAAMAMQPTAAFALYERFLNAGVFDVSRDQSDAEDAAWLDRWFSDEAQDRLRKLNEARG